MKKTQKQMIIEQVSLLSNEQRKELKGKCEDIINLHYKMRGAYFYSPPGNANGRRSYERNNSMYSEFILGGHKYEVDQDTSCSCRNVYYNFSIKTDNENNELNLNSSFISKILEAIDEIDNPTPQKPKEKKEKVYTEAYKVVAKDSEGNLRSVFDDSLYQTGKLRRQKARENHGGGFYVYMNREEAISQCKANKTFNEAWAEGKELVLVKCLVSGNSIAYGNGKVAFSEIKIAEELEKVEMAS